LNSSDIKPVRSEALDNRKKRNIGGSSLLFISLLGLINLGGLVILGLWFFNASGYQQETGQSFVQRISFLEEEISSIKAVNKESIDSLEEQTKFIDKEIRKLWDLSNKRNRKNIDSLTIQLTEAKTSFEKLFKSNNSILAKQRARALEIAKLEKVQADLKIKLTNLNALSESSDISEKLKSQEEAIAAFDAYRKQVNRALLELEEKLDKLQLKIEDSQ
jgi:HD superfamily phosphohydrolase|tara:strand:+ start:367 stop:1020 length:654 start_codon:yes stop_codon:yes gene_type:complete